MAKAKPAEQVENEPASISGESVVFPGNIETAILEVYKKIGYVHKAGEVSGGGMRYAFAKESDFIAAIRPEMIAAGITQRPDAMIVLSNDRIETVRRDAKGQEYSSYQFRVCVQVD